MTLPSDAAFVRIRSHALSRPLLNRTIALVLTLALAACSPATFLNVTAPDGGVKETDGISYAQDPQRSLDIYAPDSACQAPVVVFFYGGNWQTGRRDIYGFLGRTLARAGVIVVVPDYRQYPEVRFPAFMDDAGAAVAWTRDHVREFGGDPGKLFLMGHSAGAQIATLLALDSSYLRRAGIEPSSLAGIVGLSGPYDFLPLTDPTLKIIFGPETDWPRSQPINFVTDAAPPMLLATGTADETVYPLNTEHLAARLRESGVPVEERYYSGIGHTPVIGAFAWPLQFLAPVRSDVLDFIHSHANTPSEIPLAPCGRGPG